MKKLLAIFIFVLFTFTACTGSNWWISGQVMGVEYDSRYPNPVYNVYTTEGHDIKITLAEDVVPISWVDGVDGQILAKGDISHYAGLMVSFDSDGKIKGDSDKVVTVSSLALDKVLYTDIFTLSDGTKLNGWQGMTEVEYCLPDYTIILRDGRSPQLTENDFGMVQSGYDALTDGVMGRIIDYFESNGIYYDNSAYLQMAYDHYLSCKDRAHFGGYALETDLFLASQSEKYIFIGVDNTVPVDVESHTSNRYCVAFDKATGEYVNSLDLFVTDKEKTKQKLVDWVLGDMLLNENDPSKADMIKNLKSEYIIFRDDGIDLSYPAGVLDGAPYSYTVSFDFDDSIKEIIKKEALPFSRDKQ